jgi:hypothetical protein
VHSAEKLLISERIVVEEEALQYRIEMTLVFDDIKKLKVQVSTLLEVLYELRHLIPGNQRPIG